MPRIPALIAVLTLVGAGCSAPPASDAPAGSTPSSASAATAAPATPSRPADRTIEIIAKDTMTFSVTEITAKPGEVLAVTLVNQGTTPKFSMGHNWVLLGSGTDAMAFVIAAAEAVTTEYVPASTPQAPVLAATKLLGPNERDTVTFTVPDAPGRYEFVCSFPGHYQVGMRGVLIVE